MEQPFLETRILEKETVIRRNRCNNKFTPFTPIHTPKNTRCIRTYKKFREMAIRTNLENKRLRAVIGTYGRSAVLFPTMKSVKE